MIQEKLQTYVKTLNTMDDMMDRYTWLMDFGKKSATVPERFKPLNSFSSKDAISLLVELLKTSARRHTIPFEINAAESAVK